MQHKKIKYVIYIKQMDFVSLPEEKLKIGKTLAGVVNTAGKILPIVSCVVPALAPVNQVVQTGRQIKDALKK